MAWNILETKATSAEANMQLDAKLLDNLEGQERRFLSSNDQTTSTET
ncbi:MAG TPA: hypothetical protein VIJ14_02090 [Rhabdochlamydiaceae bacterium]